jgi:ABC-type spermidine/putrescine transport system permease subunit II
MSNEHLFWRAFRFLGRLLTFVVLVAMLLPLAIIVILSFSNQSFLYFPPSGYSFRWYSALVVSPDYRAAVDNSLLVGTISAFLATAAGTLTAVAVVRGKVLGHRVLSMLMMAPGVLPTIILAIGLYPISVLLSINGTYWALIFAHAAVALPFPFIAVCAALRGYPEQLEYAGMSLGGSPYKTFFYVTLPMIKASVFSGYVFALAFSIDELVLALFLTGPTTRTLPLLLWQQLNYELTPEIAAAATALLTFTLILVLAATSVARVAGRKYRERLG